MSLLEEYKGYHPSFESKLNLFSDENREKLIRKLTNESNKDNFLSTVSEISFGEMFAELGIELKYDKKFENNQRPDWFLSLNESKAICDVYKLRRSNKDQIKSNFQSRIIEKIGQIKANYFIKITFLIEDFDTDNYIIDDIILKLDEWLTKKELSPGDQIIIFDIFEFSILANNTKYDTVKWVGNASNIDYKHNKLKQLSHQKPNEITKKLTKYNELIENHKLSYFLCIDIDFVSGFEPSDFYEHYKGKGVEFVDFGKFDDTMDQFKHLGKNWTELGLFYDNPQLSGIITYYNSEFQILLNPLTKKLLDKGTNTPLLNKLSGLKKNGR
ncbi:hypothetical protein ACFQ0R_02225 [Psychroflexus salinarum]|uniref:Uncharacterized protein n=1 Tax=Psychroflexus salinarum TaxID=546024 RepID=A0ABW3GRK1_9FLAO